MRQNWEKGDTRGMLHQNWRRNFKNWLIIGCLAWSALGCADRDFEPILAPGTLVWPEHAYQVAPSLTELIFEFSPGDGQIDRYDIRVNEQSIGQVEHQDIGLLRLTVETSSITAFGLTDWHVVAENGLMAFPSNRHSLIINCLVDSSFVLNPVEQANSDVLPTQWDDLVSIAEASGGNAYQVSGIGVDFRSTVLSTLGCGLESLLDVVFVIDATSSMLNVIQELANNLTSLFTELAEVPDRALGAIRFGDFIVSPDNWIQVTPLQADVSQVQASIASGPVLPGGDVPESIYDALDTAIDSVGWRTDSRRVIILLTDTIPLTGSSSRATPESIQSGLIRRNIRLLAYQVVAS